MVPARSLGTYTTCVQDVTANTVPAVLAASSSIGLLDFDAIGGSPSLLVFTGSQGNSVGFPAIRAAAQLKGCFGDAGQGDNESFDHDRFFVGLPIGSICSQENA